MKILVIGPDYFNYTSSLEKAFYKLGCQTAMETFRRYSDQCSYIAKKIDKLGIVPLSKDYYRSWNNRILSRIETFNPDAIVVLNGEYLSTDTLSKIKAKHIKLVLWLIDSILRLPKAENLINYYDLIYSFDPRDIPYLDQKFNRECIYNPGGYDPEIYHPEPAQIRDIDISFIGFPTANRRVILKRVAEYAHLKNKKAQFFGRFWKKGNYWKEYRFINKYWPLNLYAQNITIDPYEVASIYRRSKICLNIHIDIHEGINPRTFEIMGTGSFELIDAKSKLYELVDVGRDLVVYSSPDDLIEKIDYYLEHNEIRNAIVANGQAKALKYSVINLAKTIFDGIVKI